MVSKYIDSVNIGPDISGGITRMFREFGGAFRAKMSKKNEPQSQKMSSRSMSDLPQLKSNLKKQKQQGLDTSVVDSGPSSASVSQASDNKKVHFNKFATVQMMG